MRIGVKSLPLCRTSDGFAFDIPLRLAFLILQHEIWTGGNWVERQHCSIVRSFKDIYNVMSAVINSHDWQIVYDVIDNPLAGQVLKTICLVFAIVLDTYDTPFWVHPRIEVFDGGKCRSARLHIVLGSHENG